MGLYRFADMRKKRELEEYWRFQEEEQSSLLTRAGAFLDTHTTLNRAQILEDIQEAEIFAPLEEWDPALVIGSLWHGSFVPENGFDTAERILTFLEEHPDCRIEDEYGIPVGTRRFLRETGLEEPDFY